MKTIVFRLSLLFLLLQLNTFSQLSFTLTYLSLNTSITCVSPSVVVQAQSHYTAGTINYSVFPSAGSQSASVFAFTNSATYTITASSPGQSNFTATISITQNTTAPTSTVSPLSQSITCINPAVQSITGTALSPTVNVYHHFNFSNGLSVGPIAGNTAMIQPPPGTHTHVVTNAINGCTVAKTFTVATGQGFPTFTLTSPIQNFSIGCAPKHTVDVVIQNAQSDPIGLPLTYSILPVNSYTLSFPGIYTVVVHDQTTGCQTRSPFSINQNILPPNFSLSVPIQTLSCFVPSTALTASSYNNVSYTWHYSTTGFTQGSVFTASIISTPAFTLLANYTLTLLDLNNACKSLTVIPIYQNLFQPNALISGATPTLTGITCLQPTLTLINLSTSSIPPNTFPSSLPVISLLWNAPPPAPQLSNSISYQASVPGTYTLLAKDLNNGCTSSTTFTVDDNRNYPVINTPLAPGPFTVACPSNTPMIEIEAFVYVTNNFTYQYDWKSAAGTIKIGTIVATPPYGIVSAIVSSAGYYTLTVNNTVSGCSSSVIIGVYGCVGIEEKNKADSFISLYPNPGSGNYTVILKEDAPFPITLEVYNSLAQIVKSVELNTGEKQFTLDSAPGIYFIELSKEGRRLYYSRVIKN